MIFSDLQRCSVILNDFRMHSARLREARLCVGGSGAIQAIEPRP